MPGHRKRRQFKAGWSIRQIAADTHLGASTVHRLWRRWLEQGNVAIYRNVGATMVDRRILRQAVAAPQATCTAILQHVQDTLDHSISTRTISRRLVANGLHSCRPLRRLPLTPPNRRQRLEWCQARSTWMTEWHRVVFSDESRFCLSSDSRRVRVWRRRGERSNPAAIVERPTVRQRGIMVWGAIAYDSRSPLLRIQGTMTAQRYVDDVLRPDNARPHTARISQQALQDVQMLPWPTYSPDLSPIKHVWDIIGRRLHALPQPRSEDELWQMVEREWRAIPQDAIRTLIDSLPRRVAACIAVRDMYVAVMYGGVVYVERVARGLHMLVNEGLGILTGNIAGMFSHPDGYRSTRLTDKRKPIGKVLPEVSKKRNVRSAETAVQREHSLRIDRERASTSRAAESVGQRENRLQQDRDRASTSRAAEFVGQRENRLRQNRNRVSTSRAAETPQEHTARILNDNKGQQVEDMLTDLDLTPLKSGKNTYLSKSTGTESAKDITAINYNIAPTTQWKILANNQLLRILNISWQTGKLPKNWKISIIVPILKPNKDAKEYKNYRPIALTSKLCKITERIIHSRLIVWLTNNNKINLYQAAYRSQHCTTDQLFYFCQSIIDSFQEKPPKKTTAIFLDMTSAFDRVWREKLREKLHNIGTYSLESRRQNKNNLDRHFGNEEPKDEISLTTFGLVDPPFSENEVKLTAFKFGKRKSPGPEEIDNTVVKALVRMHPSLLSRLFNRCLDTGTFPEAWKVTQVVLLERFGRKGNSPNDYRMLSLLVCLGMVLDSLLAQRLKHWLESNELLSSFQHGFREGKSTTTARNEVLEGVEMGLNKGAWVFFVALDIDGAFNSMSWNKLMRNLMDMG
ncbi:Transposase [Cordylochernes scorpioides]|uniref:Transposase n=1 Tax=Cordylochernes scorpioides TaxID=51811 RepID=A0ABY6LN77_9ARAC|nr:Transposase [Cordylochernes scorpioides]